MKNKSLIIALFSMGLAFVGSNASAQVCDPKDPKCDPPPPPKKGFCHNIGGPMDLGANCDGTGTCSYYTVDEFGNPGPTIDIPENHFLGIIIGVPLDNEKAIAAHLAHGDGHIIMTFDPPLHLASTGQNHRASNVECFAERAITTQPPEPGN